MTNTPNPPATDEDLVTFRQWNRSMLSHPTLAVATVVERMDARIEEDRARIAELEQMYGELQDWIGEQMTPPDVMEATITRLEDIILKVRAHIGIERTCCCGTCKESRAIKARRAQKPEPGR